MPLLAVVTRGRVLALGRHQIRRLVKMHCVSKTSTNLEQLVKTLPSLNSAVCGEVPSEECQLSTLDQISHSPLHSTLVADSTLTHSTHPPHSLTPPTLTHSTHPPHSLLHSPFLPTPCLPFPLPADPSQSREPAATN